MLQKKRNLELAGNVRAWQRALEEWFGALEQTQAHWALHRDLVILTVSWAPQAVLCALESSWDEETN